MDERIFAGVHVVRRQTVPTVVAFSVERFTDDPVLDYLHAVLATVLQSGRAVAPFGRAVCDLLGRDSDGDDRLAPFLLSRHADDARDAHDDTDGTDRLDRGRTPSARTVQSAGP